MGWSLKSFINTALTTRETESSNHPARWVIASVIGTALVLALTCRGCNDDNNEKPTGDNAENLGKVGQVIGTDLEKNFTITMEDSNNTGDSSTSIFQ